MNVSPLARPARLRLSLDADLRLGFGRVDPTHDTIIHRVIRGTLGIKDAVSQAKEYRRSQSATGTD